MEDELDLTQEQIDNMTQEEWDNLPIVTGPNPSRTTPGPAGTINLSNEELENPSKQAGSSPKLSAYKTPTVWEMKNYHSGIRPLNVRQSYEFDYDKHEDAALPQNEGDKPWGNISQGRGFLSNLASNVKAKLKDPSFQKDASAIAGIASFIVPWGRIAKAGGKLFKAFSSTPNQLLRGKATSTAKTAFKPLVTNNKVYDTKMVNDAFAKRFGKPSPPKTQPKTKYQKSYHENEILEPKSGYYSSDPLRPGWPAPNQGNYKLQRMMRLRDKLEAARKITGPKGL